MPVPKPTIIVPCAGKSTRFPNLRPKYLLVNPNGNLLVIDAISKLNLSGCQLVVTILKEHEEKYQVSRMFKEFFGDLRIQVCILNEPTKSQSETVYKTIKQLSITGPVLVKDSDNIFQLDPVYEEYNYVSVLSLEQAGLVNASNKSYCQSDLSGLITAIEEKKVISNTFSVGGYYFSNAQDFSDSFLELSQKESEREIYVSMVINNLIVAHHKKFKIKEISQYVDLGTIKEWTNYKKNMKTYFIDIDGVVVENSAEYFEPKWGTTSALPNNVELIKNLYTRGNQIILTTSRTEKFREITQKQLAKAGVNYHQLVMGIHHSQRVLINDFSNSNPYPSAIAISLPRNSDELEKYID